MAAMDHEMAAQERARKELVFKNSTEGSEKGGRSMDGFRTNAIVREAREARGQLAGASSN